MEIPEILKEMGVVGAGGAGFPTYAKLKHGGIACYIANGAECEPLLWENKELMLKYPYMVLKGLWYLKNYTGASRAVIVVKEKYRDIVNVLRDSITENKFDIEIFELEDFFPAGDEQVLVYEVTKKVVPEAGIPLFVNAIVNNVETLFNVYRAIEENTPVTEKFVTIGGQVDTPVTVKVPIGTNIGWLLEKLKIDYRNKIIIDGGPMMGKITSPDVPVTKTTGGLLIFSPEHTVVYKKNLQMDKIWRKAKIACIQCRYCTEQCPRFLLGHGIEPNRIMLSVAYNLSGLYTKQALLCSECGVCESYACPQGLSPRRVNQEIKKKLSETGEKYKPIKNEYAPREMREWRKVPMSRLKVKLDIKEYDMYAPLSYEEFLPPVVSVLTKQHTGATAVPIVKKGQRVKKGDLVAKVPPDKLGCNIHASIDGIVDDVQDTFVFIRREALI